MNNYVFDSLLRLCTSLTKRLGQQSDIPFLTLKYLAEQTDEDLAAIWYWHPTEMEVCLKAIELYVKSIPNYDSPDPRLKCNEKSTLSLIYYLLSGQFKYFDGGYKELDTLLEIFKDFKKELNKTKYNLEFNQLAKKLKDQIVELAKFSLEHPEAFDILPSEFEDLFEYSSMLESIWYYQDELKEENPELGFKEKLERFVEEHEKA